jgi:hypothetical protein
MNTMLKKGFASMTEGFLGIIKYLSSANLGYIINKCFL